MNCCRASFSGLPTLALPVSPEGTEEISRWRKPPDIQQKNEKALAGAEEFPG